MHEHLRPRNKQLGRRFSPEEAGEIYRRAAHIESETLFEEDDTLSRSQLEDAAKRAGISAQAVEAAIDQMEGLRAAVQKADAESSIRRRINITLCMGLCLMFTGGALVLKLELVALLLLLGGVFPCMAVLALSHLRHNS